MRKIVSILLAVGMCLSSCMMLFSCNEETQPAPETTEGVQHEHAYKTEWTKDATYHWHECLGETCLSVADKAEHTWNEGTATADGTTYACTVCGATKDEPAAIGGISEEKWDSMIQLANFDNVTFFYEATFIGGDKEGGPYGGTFKLLSDRIIANGEVDDNPETMNAVKTWYVGSALAIADNFDLFVYDKANDCYNATENIVYSVNILGYDATITAADAIVRLDADMSIAEITCKMTQEFEEDGNPKTFILDVTFRFSDYGTTVA